MIAVTVIVVTVGTEECQLLMLIALSYHLHCRKIHKTFQVLPACKGIHTRQGCLLKGMTVIIRT